MQDMDGSKEEVAPLIQQLLQDKAVLLQECFGIQVDAEGRLAALPQLIEGHCPDLDRLPLFVLQLARDVDWEDEKQCFKGLAQVIALRAAGLERNHDDRWEKSTFLFFLSFCFLLKRLVQFLPWVTLLASQQKQTKTCLQQL